MNWALFATLTVQLYLYYQAFPTDRIFIKGLVYIVYCISLIQVTLVTIDAFNTFGYGFGDPSALTTAQFKWLVAPVLGGIVTCVVQSFYASRLYKLSGSRIVPSILVFTPSLQAALGMGTTGIFNGVSGRKLLKSNLLKPGGTLPASLTTTGVLFLAGNASIDIIIAGCMTYYLLKIDTGFRRTHALVTKLIRLSIETGVLTALIAVLELALFFGIPGKLYYTVPTKSISMVYANTMFAVLNSRMQILNGRTDIPTSDILISIPSHLRGTVGGPVEFSDGSNPAIELKQMNVRIVRFPWVIVH
ncbi:hypothetical protein B0H16DRAFT_1740682 [Mycena metata]|uniref:DUF6534 domain-containing protein n=1 Tax=Mycena metata TaxID=1033252 RepID=A0AAD7HCK0_9AGAR|nr:hypothetical protein B0H16DRAFT_1740682 [Mycena metata]